MVNEIIAGVDAGIMAPDTDVLCRADTSTWYQRRWRPPKTSATPPPPTIPKYETPRRKPTLHVIAQRSLQLRQRVAPGAQLQQPQRHRDAEGGHDQVGAVLRLGERSVEADGEAGVELRHAALEAAVPLAPLRQPKADDEGGRQQATHVLRGGRVHGDGASKNTETRSCWDETEGWR